MPPKAADTDKGADPLPGLQGELIKLRKGGGVKEVMQLARLGPNFWNAVMPVYAKPVEEAKMIDTACSLIERAVRRIPDDLQAFARTEFNIERTGLNLGARQYALARELGFDVRTIRRRGDKALHHTALQLLTHAAPEQTVGTLKRFWNISDRQRVDIVCSELPPANQPYYAHRRDPNYVRYAKFADLDSLVYLRIKLAESFPGSYVRDFSALEYPDSQADHLLVLGGPDWNSKMAEFQENLPVEFGWDDDKDQAYLRFDGQDFCPEWSSNGSLICDYGMFARLRLRHGLTVSLICGCLTYGVLGASHCFFDPAVARSNAELMESEFGELNFAVLMKVHDIGGIVQSPDLSVDCVAACRSDFEFSTTFEQVRI